MAMERGETLYGYLDRRERELSHQLAELRGQVQIRETELAHIQSAKRQIGNFGGADKSGLGVPEMPDPTIPDAANDQTIKDLILKALWFGFRKDGATPALLREFIQDIYGREIDRTSISPQLSRLRDSGQVKHKLIGPDAEGRWFLTKACSRYMNDKFGVPPVEVALP